MGLLVSGLISKGGYCTAINKTLGRVLDCSLKSTEPRKALLEHNKKGGGSDGRLSCFLLS